MTAIEALRKAAKGKAFDEDRAHSDIEAAISTAFPGSSTARRTSHRAGAA